MPIDISKIPLDAKINQKYKVENNALIMVNKPNIKDLIQTKIGDDKDLIEFQPQLKIERWDNEVNFSLRLKDNQPDPPQVITEEETIKWVKQKIEAHFYNKPEISENGGYEFEVILKEKPNTNILEFTIETKGLNFYKQLPLTQEEIDQGANRPENIINSYAVYHATKGGLNDSAGMEYKTGKAFHIYRIKAIDAKGKEVWCDQDIDAEHKTHIITIPQKFLDEAVYPIIVDPTFGYTSIGGSTESDSMAYEDWPGPVYDNRTGGKFTTTEAGTLDSISGYMGGNDDCDVKGFLNEFESNGSGSHGEIFGSSGANQSSSFGWRTYNAGDENLSSSTDYTISFLGDGSSLGNMTGGYAFGLKYDSGGYNLGSSSGGQTYESPEDPWTPDYEGNESPFDFKYSIYATYTASGTEDSDDRDAKITGTESTTSDRDAKVTGNESTNNDRDAKITGIVGDIYSREQGAALKTDDATLNTLYDSGEISDVADDDDTYVDQDINDTDFATHLYKKYNTNNLNNEQINVTIKLKSSLAPSSSTVYLQIYNHDSDEWETLDSDNTTAADTEFTLTGAQSSDLANYYDVNYIVALRVYQEVT